ncbi:MAG: nucleotidyltransferase family protein, partial [Firmicutes bacterium]|nr:nucleotidyltransferase family protein [Bacillota bacterium]
MIAVGITAEYNPFHNGHKYHLMKSKELTGADVSVAVMSGNFTQRGEPACTDKWTRAEMAVKNGVDLVFELPFVYAANSA